MTKIPCVNRVALISITVAGCVVGASGANEDGPKVKPNDAQPATCYKAADTDACGLPAGVWVRNPHGDGSVNQCAADARWTAQYECTDYYGLNNYAWVQFGYSDSSGNWIYAGFEDHSGWYEFGNW
jgi:hypothetical protein